MNEWMNEWNVIAMLLKGTLNSLFYKQITAKKLKSPPKKNSSNGHANYPLCFNYADCQNNFNQRFKFPQT